MEGRKFTTAGSYRYGFNGKEKDNEVKGEGVQYDYGFRIYDTRIGRFFSVDPLFKEYPWYTPFQFAGNKPINCIDLDGLEEKVVFYYEWTNSYGEKITHEDVIRLKPEQQRPEFGNKGTLTHFSIQDPKSFMTKQYDVYSYIKEEEEGGLLNWFKGLFTKIEKIRTLQLVIFGSGTEDFGSEPDYSKPIETINYKEFSKMFDIITAGMGNVPKKPDETTLAKLLKKGGEEYLKQIEKSKKSEEWIKSKEENYIKLEGKLQPNDEYSIDQDIYPWHHTSSFRHKSIITDAHGNPMDTIVQPSVDDIRKGKSKADTIRNRGYKNPNNIIKF